MNEDCQNLSCPTPANPVQEYLNQYSLEATLVGNTRVERTVNGQKISIPANTFTVSISPDTSFPINVQGCQSLISIPVPPGSTFAQIQALAQSAVQLAAEQQAECDATGPTPVHPQPSPAFLNETVSFDPACPNDEAFIISVALPPGVSRDGQLVVVAPGIFSSNTQAGANHNASQWLNDWVNGLLVKGQAFCQPPCPVFATTFSDVDMGNYSFLMGDDASHTLITLAYMSGNVFVVNTNNYLPTDTGLGGSSQYTLGCFCSAINSFLLWWDNPVIADPGQIRVVDLSGTLTFSTDFPTIGGSKAYALTETPSHYDSAIGVAFFVAFCSPNTNIFIGAYDPNTTAVSYHDTGYPFLTDNLLGGFYFSPGKVWLAVGGAVNQIVCYETTGLTVVGMVALTNGVSTMDYNNYYDAVSDKLFVCLVSGTNDQLLVEIDPATFLIDHTYNLTALAGFTNDGNADGNFSVVGKDGILYAADYYGNSCKIDTLTRSISCLALLPESGGNSFTGIGLIGDQLFLPNRLNPLNGDGFNVYDL